MEEVGTEEEGVKEEGLGRVITKTLGRLKVAPYLVSRLHDRQYHAGGEDIDLIP